MRLSGIQFLIIGFFLVLYGMVVPWLIMLKFVESTFFLSFTSYIGTFLGLMFGVIGTATYVRERRDHD